MDLSRLLKPQNVAIVGASPKRIPGRYDFINWYKEAGYSGQIYPVNPNYEEVDGYKCYPSLNDIPEVVDLVLMMRPAEMTIEILKETQPDKVRFVVVIASGFSELGNDNLQNELIEIAGARGMRVIGPNCMGIYSREGRLAQARKQPFGPGAGEIAMISQSGGNSANLVRSFMNSGLNTHSSISIGNQCDLSIENFLQWYDRDEDVKIISGYVEDFNDGRKFIETVKDISSRKPVILWKGGTTTRGSQAASSHTGAMAISNDVWKGVVRQTGIIPADNLMEIVYLSRAIIWETLPKGPGACFISPGGAHSVTMTDEAIGYGLEIPVLPDPTIEELSKIIAKVNTIIENPIDVGAASYLPDPIKNTIRTVAKEDSIHSFVIYHFVFPYKGTGARELGVEMLKAYGEIKQEIDKPIYVALYRPFVHFPEADDAKRETIEYLNKYQIPYTFDMESSVKMLSRLWDYSRYLQGRE